MKGAWRAKLEQEFEVAQAYKPNKADWLDGRWAGLKAARDDADDPRRAQTGVSAQTLADIRRKLGEVPSGRARCCPRAPRSASRARTASAAPSRNATRSSSTRRTRPASRRSTTSAT